MCPEDDDMSSEIMSRRIAAASSAMAPFIRFMSEGSWMQKMGQPEVCDFIFGNPQEMPLPGFVEALGKWSVPQNKEWFAYKNNEVESQKVVVEGLRERRGVTFEEEDIFLTNGAFAAIAVVLCAILNPGDEVIFISPPWFFYEALITTYD